MVLDFGLAAIRFPVMCYKGQFYAGMTCNNTPYQLSSRCKPNTTSVLREIWHRLSMRWNQVSKNCYWVCCRYYQSLGCFVSLGNRIMDPDGGWWSCWLWVCLGCHHIISLLLVIQFTHEVLSYWPTPGHPIYTPACSAYSWLSNLRTSFLRCSSIGPLLAQSNLHTRFYHISLLLIIQFTP